MGGTGSVVQHGRGGCNRAGERSLLKLYNRNRRDDRVCDKLLTTDDGHSKVRNNRSSEPQSTHPVQTTCDQLHFVISNVYNVSSFELHYL